MCSVEHLREFIQQRLTAAAEEIFTEFEKTIVQYKEETDRQRRLLEISWKPQIKLHRLALPQQHDLQEQEVLSEQQHCCQERNFTVDQEEPDPPQFKTEQEEPCSGQGRGQLGMKEEPDALMETATYEESDQREPEPNSEQLHSHSSDTFIVVHLKPNQTLEGINGPIQDKEEMDHQHRALNFTQTLKIKLHRTDLQPQHDIKEEKVLADQQLCSQERHADMDQEEPELPQIKEERVELCSSQEAGQLGLKEETDTLMVTAAYQEGDCSDPEPNCDQVFSHSSPETESHNRGASKCEDSGSTTNAECSDSVINSPNSESHCSTDSSKKPVNCDVRGKGFQNEFKMKEHQRSHTGRKRYSCETCGKRYSRCDGLSVHMRTHTGERPYSCNTCKKSFTYSSSLKKHMRLHTGEEPYPCNSCEKSFMYSSSLRKHMSVHTGEKPYPCNTCKKSFMYSSSLRKHMSVHTAEKPYPCNTCEKSFMYSSLLRNHMRSHTAEKPYSCETCGKRFRRREHLSVHMRSHTGEKPFSCNTCKKSFTYSSSLRNHVSVHTTEKPYSCETCGKRFRRLDYLSLHMRSHTGEKPYSCNSCKKTFTYSSSLRNHMRLHTAEKL